MKKNMGTADRLTRIGLAIVLLALYLTDTVEGTLGYIFAGVAVIFLLTSLISFCPLYAIVGIKTCPAEKE